MSKELEAIETEVNLAWYDWAYAEKTRAPRAVQNRLWARVEALQKKADEIAAREGVTR